MTTEEILALKPEADRIMSISGNTRGNSLKTDVDFIRRREGDEGVAQLEGALALLGYPVTYTSIKGFDWYPEAQAVLGIYVSQKLFSWNDEDLFDMGYAAPATSLIVKMLLRFVSVEATFKKAPSVWKKHYDFGDMETVSLDTENQCATFRITGYPFFQYMDPYFDGFLNKTFEIVVGSEGFTIERKSCTDESEHCRLYVGTWGNEIK